MKNTEAFNNVNQFFHNAAEKTEAFEQKYRGEIDAEKTRMEDHRRQLSMKSEATDQKLADLQKKLDLYYTIAKEHCAYRIEHFDAVKQAPDFALLSRQSAKIDQFNYNDPAAKELVEILAGCYRWLDAQKRLQYLISTLSNDNTTDKVTLDVMEAEYAINRKELEKELLGGLETLKLSINSLQLAAIRALPEYTMFAPDTLLPVKTAPFFMTCYPLTVPELIKAQAEEALGDCYDPASSSLVYPYYADCRGGFSVLINYHNRTKEIRHGIQTIILNFIRQHLPDHVRITLIDRVNYSAALIRDLLPLDGILDDPCQSSSQISAYLKKLTDEYQSLESSLGSSTLDQYNQNGAKYPYRLLILHEEAGNGHDPEQLRYLRQNARTLGITVITLNFCRDPESVKPADRYDLVINESGSGFTSKDGTKFTMLKSDIILTDGIRALFTPKKESGKQSNLFFDHIPYTVPQKGVRKRGVISIPFGIDDNGNIARADFTNTNFAGFMEGGAGSGKSSMLHAMIMALMMSCHPDELELWLVDFKMTEFKDYARFRLPHVKCVLLESSEELVFDLVDRLTDKLNERMVRFSHNNWISIKNVPHSVYMPDIFVIIDEFGEMSRILKETAGEGIAGDYCAKLEYLLREGRSFGFHFIFANQAYTEGSQGLTDMAKLQIRNRFALLNDRSEIREILGISSPEGQLNQWINNIQPFETLFRMQKNEAKDNEDVMIRKYRNLYIPDEVKADYFKKIRAQYRYTGSWCPDDNDVCQRKDLIYINGSVPQSFMQNLLLMDEKEEEMLIHNNEVPVYAGAPMSFDKVFPFLLRRGAAENILLVGMDSPGVTAVTASVLASWSGKGAACEIWADPGQTAFANYAATVLSDYTTCTDTEEICSRVTEFKKMIKARKSTQKLIVVTGYERIYTTMELLSDDWGDEDTDQQEAPVTDIGALLERHNNSTDPEERKALRKQIDEYSAFAESMLPQVVSEVYDARDDIRRLVKLGPVYGIHFLFVFERAASFKISELNLAAFGHKLLFPMSHDDAIALEANKQHPETLKAGCFLYTDGYKRVSLRPYIIPGLPLYPEWQVDEEGNVTERKF